jgi:hypothetical protein
VGRTRNHRVLIISGPHARATRNPTISFRLQYARKSVLSDRRLNIFFFSFFPITFVHTDRPIHTALHGIGGVLAGSDVRNGPLSSVFFYKYFSITKYSIVVGARAKFIWGGTSLNRTPKTLVAVHACRVHCARVACHKNHYIVNHQLSSERYLKSFRLSRETSTCISDVRFEH